MNRCSWDRSFDMATVVPFRSVVDLTRRLANTPVQPIWLPARITIGSPSSMWTRSVVINDRPMSNSRDATPWGGQLSVCFGYLMYRMSVKPSPGAVRARQFAVRGRWAGLRRFLGPSFLAEVLLRAFRESEACGHAQCRSVSEELSSVDCVAW